MAGVVRSASGHSADDFVESVPAPTLDFSSPSRSRAGSGRGGRGGAGAAADGSSSARGAGAQGRGQGDATQTHYPSLLEPDGPVLSKRTTHALIVVGVLVLVAGVVACALTLSVFPAAEQQRADDMVASFYIPTQDSLGLWTTFTDQRAPLAYDIFTVYNITNPWDVLYRGALPVVQEVGPFVYQRVETRELVAPSPSAPANEVQFRTRVQLLKTTSTVLLLNRSGGYEAIQPKDADDNLVYMFNPTLLFLAAQLQLNPLNEEAFQGFYARCAAAHGGGRPSIEWCIDRALQTASGGAASLNTSYTGSQQGLIPLRSVSQWLGVQGVQVPEDALWANVNQFIRNDTETYSAVGWAYFINSTQPAPLVLADVLQVEARAFDRHDLQRAMTYTQWNGARVLLDVGETRNESQWNILDYGREFAGWGEEVNIAAGRYCDLRQTHPNTAPAAAPAVNIWSSPLIRPLLFSADGGGPFSLRGVELNRYVFDHSNFYVTPNSANMYFSQLNGLANCSQALSYTPMFMSTSRFWNYTADLRRYHLDNQSQPTNDADASYVDIEPSSGLIANAALRLQYNLLLPALNFSGTSVSYNFGFNGRARRRGFSAAVDPPLVPCVIHEQRRQFNEFLAHDLRMIQHTPAVQRKIRLVGGLLGGLAALLGLLVLVHGVRRSLEAARTQRPTYGATAALLYDSRR